MCKLRDDTMSQAGELPMEKKMEDQGMFRPLKNLSAAEVAPQGAAVCGEAATLPDGWKISNACNGRISVTKDGVAGYSAQRDDDNIASSILYELACGLRYAAVSPRAADVPSEPSENINFLCSTMDAQVWATEFCKLNKASDHSMMVAWFANAIMAGFDEANLRRAADALDSQPTDACPFCGSENIRVFDSFDEHGQASFGVQCCDSTCSIAGPERGSEAQALDAWRDRAAHSRASSAPVAPIAPPEPVMWFEAEASAKGQPLRHVIGSMLYSTRMHTTKPGVLNNALWPLYEHPAPQQEGSEAGNG